MRIIKSAMRLCGELNDTMSQQLPPVNDNESAREYRQRAQSEYAMVRDACLRKVEELQRLMDELKANL